MTLPDCPKCGQPGYARHCKHQACPWHVCKTHVFDSKGRAFDRAGK